MPKRSNDAQRMKRPLFESSTHRFGADFRRSILGLMSALDTRERKTTLDEIRARYCLECGMHRDDPYCQHMRPTESEQP